MSNLKNNRYNQKHSFPLVATSPWPSVGSMSALMLTFTSISKYLRVVQIISFVIILLFSIINPNFSSCDSLSNISGEGIPITNSVWFGVLLFVIVATGWVYCPLTNVFVFCSQKPMGAVISAAQPVLEAVEIPVDAPQIEIPLTPVEIPLDALTPIDIPVAVLAPLIKRRPPSQAFIDSLVGQMSEDQLDVIRLASKVASDREHMEFLFAKASCKSQAMGDLTTWLASSGYGLEKGWYYQTCFLNEVALYIVNNNYFL